MRAFRGIYISKRLWIPMVFCLAFLSQDRLYAAGANVSFKDARSEHKSGAMASNLLRVTNESGKKLSFYLNLSLPPGWGTTKAYNTMYQVEAGDSLFIPVKLLLNGQEQGNTSYMVSASLLSQNNIQFASASWYLQIENESRWVASTDRKESYFINDADTSGFSLTIKNTGNAMEWFTVKLNPHNQLQVVDKELNEVPVLFNVNLPPGADTSMSFLVKSKPLASKHYHHYTVNEGRRNESYPVRVSVQALNKDKSPGRIWKNTIDFRRNASEVRFNEYSRQVLPVTFELRADNILESATTLSLNLYGTSNLEKSRILTYRFQSFFSEQYYNEKSFKGNYHYIGYFTPKAAVEAGNITGFRTFGQTPSGRGIKGEVQIKRHRAGALYIQNPELFTSPSLRSAGVKHEYLLNKFSLINYYQQTWNSISKFDGRSGVTGFDFRIRHQHLFGVRAGASEEVYYLSVPQKKVTGVGGAFTYSGTVGKVTLRTAVDYGSASYSGYRGILNMNYGITFRKSEQYSWTFSNAFYNQQPTYYDQLGNSYRGMKSESQRYELRLSMKTKSASNAIRAAYYDDKLLNIHYITRGLGFDFHPVSRSEVRFVATVFASYIKLPDFDIDDYFTSQVRASLRYRSFTTNIRYNYGPYQAFEHIRFTKYGINHQSFFLNSYYGFWLIPGMLSLEPSLNYSYETLYRKSRLTARPELFYFSKNGWQFNIYGEFLLSTQKIARLDDRNLISTSDNQESRYKDLVAGVGLKKEFGVPLPGKKYYTAKVTAFKDLNGNMKLDKNEEPLENILITIKPDGNDSAAMENSFLKARGEEVITDEKGSVVFRNLPKGIYTLTPRPLVENAGWFPAGEQMVALSKSDEIMLPFSKGIHLSGAVTVDFSINTANARPPELSRIRVTAVDSAGRVYSSLTNNEGKFDIYVPVGSYRVTINQNAIDDRFVLDNNLVIVNLDGLTEAFNIGFRVREKERAVKVKKFNNNGTIVEEPE